MVRTRIKNTLQHPCKEDFLEFVIKIGAMERRGNKLPEPILQNQGRVEDLVKKSFLDEDTRTQSITILNLISILVFRFFLSKDQLFTADFDD